MYFIRGLIIINICFNPNHNSILSHKKNSIWETNIFLKRFFARKIWTATLILKTLTRRNIYQLCIFVWNNLYICISLKRKTKKMPWDFPTSLVREWIISHFIQTLLLWVTTKDKIINQKLCHQKFQSPLSL